MPLSCGVRRGTGIDAVGGRIGAGRRLRPAAFTLMELLTVMGIITVLLAILLPVLAHARERGRRTACRNNIHQFILGIHLYANDADSRLPSGAPDGGADHTPILSGQVHKTMVSLLGGGRPLVCPYLGKPFTDPNGWRYDPYGYIIGYNYLGGHGGTPWPAVGPANAEWKSPQSALDAPSLPVVTELNDWSKGEKRTFAPHARRGTVVRHTEQGSGGMPSADIGATGGNRGFLDGAVSWRDMADMSIYIGSQNGNEDTCLAAW